MIAIAAPARRSAAMALWSTYTPVGTSLGLLISATFAAGSRWRNAYLLHGALFLALALVALALPKPPAMPAPTQRRSPLALLLSREGIAPLRLALAFGFLILLGLGVSVVFPRYASHLRALSISTAARVLAAANLAMIIGSATSGALLSRGVRAGPLFAALALGGSIAGTCIFAPQPSLALTIAALGAWSACTGAAMAVLAAQLPQVAAPEHRAAAAGLLSQSGALLTFVTPLIWLSALALDLWWALALIVMAGWLGGALLLPRARPAPAPAESGR
jgi:MFS family permease